MVHSTPTQHITCLAFPEVQEHDSYLQEDMELLPAVADTWSDSAVSSSRVTLGQYGTPLEMGGSTVQCQYRQRCNSTAALAAQNHSALMLAYTSWTQTALPQPHAQPPGPL
jgi:hypothetical protein